jgi:hypothetical protein
MKLLSVLLGFFVIFNFPVPFLYNSAIVAVLISIFIYSFNWGNNKSFKKLRIILRSKYFWSIFVLYIILLLYSITTTILHQTYDYSIIKANVLTLLIVLISFFIYPIIETYFIKDKNNLDSVVAYLLYLFLVQSIIQIAAFIFPSFADLVHFFQKVNVAEKDYGGIRALALTGNPFFDLAAGYGFILILYFYSFMLKNVNIFLSSGLFLGLFIGSFFAGRTAFVGLGIGVIYYLFFTGNFLTRLFSLSKFLVVGLGVIFVLYTFLPVNVKEMVENNLLPFAFEFVYNYMDNKELTTKSTAVLDNMYFPISNITFIFGDGKYVNSDGSYYMHTDAGYMRNTLYYGFLGVLFMVLGQMYLFKKPFLIIKKSLRTGLGYNLQHAFLFVSLFFYMVVLHYKGEVLLFMPLLQSLMVFLALAVIFPKQQFI